MRPESCHPARPLLFARTSLLAALLATASCEKRAEPYYARESSETGPSGGALDPTPAQHPSTPAPPVSSASSAARELSGRVLETYDSDTGTYTYAKLSLADGGEAWVAGPLTPLATGQLVLAGGATLQRGFPTRQRTFDELWLAQTLVADTVTAPIAAAPRPAAGARAEAVEAAEGGLDIAAVHARAAALAGQTVRVRGRVTRVTPMIGGTWVHLQDGSADAAQDDLTFILAEGEAEFATGALVTLEGTLSLDHEMARAHRAEAIVIEKAKKL